MSLHLELVDPLAAAFAGRLEAPPELARDALILRLANGVRLEVRYAAADAYALRWTWGDVELAIDTAPTHPHLPGAPSHFHAADGRVLADPLTRCGAAPLDNLTAVVEALLDDPLLTG